MLLTTQNYKLKTNSGFTLIELLVVIAIIGMLSSVVLASLNSAREKSRDARRLQDAKQVQTALELYYNDNGSYPVPADSYFANLTALTPTYIPTMPEDPRYTTGTNRYRYWYSDQYNGYTILVRSEENAAWCKIEFGDGYSSWDTESSATCN